MGCWAQALWPRRWHRQGLRSRSPPPTPTTVTGVGYQAPATSVTIYVRNPGSVASNKISVPVTGGSGGGGGGGSVPVVTPANPTLVLDTTQQFSAAGATAWSAVAGT